MTAEPSRYPRREFLGQCAAAPLMPLAVNAVDNGLAMGAEPSIALPKVRAIPEADLAKEIESLLKLVDPAVLYRYEPLAEDKNAWPLWEQAGKALVDEPEDEEYQEALNAFVERGAVSSSATLRRILNWVDQNEKARSLTDQGISRGALELPRAKKPFRLSLPMDEISIFRRLAQLKALFCRVCSHQGDSSRAAREADSVLAMGTILIRSECLVVDYLVALAVVGIGAEAMYRCATAPGASDEQRQAAIQSLASAKASNDDFKRALRVEFCRYFLPYVACFPNDADARELAAHYITAGFDSDFEPTENQLHEYQRCIRQIAALLEGHEKPLDKEATIRLGSELHVRFFAELDKFWIERDRKALEPLQKELSAWPDETQPDLWEMMGLADNPNPPRKLTDMDLKRAREALRSVENVLGKYMITQACSTANAFGVEMQQARLEARRIKIGLYLYEKKHGSLPSKLDALVEDKLLREVPTDPYDGKPFKYSADRRVIWSVDQEGKNKGLVPEKDDRENLFDEDIELTWRISRTV